MDVSAHFSALDDEEFFVIEGWTLGVRLPGVPSAQLGACLRRYGKTHRRLCLVRTTTTTTSSVAILAQVTWSTWLESAAKTGHPQVTSTHFFVSSCLWSLHSWSRCSAVFALSIRCPSRCFSEPSLELGVWTPPAQWPFVPGSQSLVSEVCYMGADELCLGIASLLPRCWPTLIAADLMVWLGWRPRLALPPLLDGRVAGCLLVPLGLGEGSLDRFLSRWSSPEVVWPFC